MKRVAQSDGRGGARMTILAHGKVLAIVRYRVAGDIVGALDALAGPFPDVARLPTGGIEPEDVTAYLEAGATCVGLGSTLVGATPPSTAGDIEAIAARAAAVMGLVPA